MEKIILFPNDKKRLKEFQTLCKETDRKAKQMTLAEKLRIYKQLSFK